ncbi:OsmC family protein [Geodermatophilus sp. SYSU D00079]
MDATALRDLQAPLKQRYRDDPASARASMHAEGEFADPGITCTVQTWAGPARAGLHPSTGGDGSDACSGDMLLQALVACAGVTMRSVATAMGVAVRSARLTARADMDARGTLGVSREVPVGLGEITVDAELDTDADDATLEKLAQLTERYCVVARSLARPPHLQVRRAVPAGGQVVAR